MLRGLICLRASSRSFLSGRTPLGIHRWERRVTHSYAYIRECGGLFLLLGVRNTRKRGRGRERDKREGDGSDNTAANWAAGVREADARRQRSTGAPVAMRSANTTKPGRIWGFESSAAVFPRTRNAIDKRSFSKSTAGVRLSGSPKRGDAVEPRDNEH